VGTETILARKKDQINKAIAVAIKTVIHSGVLLNSKIPKTFYRLTFYFVKDFIKIAQ
jgi:hypothetical protein